MKYAPPFHRSNGLFPVLWVFAALLILPLILADSYARHICILAFVYAVLASSWDFSLGFGGIFNFAHVAFFAIGLYGYGIGTKILGIDPWIAIVVAPVASVAFAVLLAIPILRLEGIYVILVTVAASQLLLKLIVSQSDVTGGTSGMVLLPRLTIGDYRLTEDGRIGYYYLALAMLGLSTLVLYKLERSSLGRAVKALRDNKYYALSRGVSEARTRLHTLCASALLPGLAGAFYGSYVRVASIEVFGLGFLTLVLSILLVGGVSTTWGPILATFLIVVLAEVLAAYGAWRDVVIALVIIVVVLVYPGGLFSGLQELWDLADRRKTAGIAAWRRRFRKGARTALMGCSDRLTATGHGGVAIFDTGEDKPALLCIHGNSSCKEAFHHLVRAFRGRHRIVAFDLPGHGVSCNGDPAKDYSLDAGVEIAAELAGKLGLDRPVVFGWSLGGYVALEYAARGHPLCALAICGTAPLGAYPDHLPAAYVASAHLELTSKRFLSWHEKREYADKTVATAGPGSEIARLAVWRADGRAREQLVAGMKTVDWQRQLGLLVEGRIPFAMINGTEDPFINHAYCAALPYGAIWRGAPQNIDGGGHAPFLAAPDSFNRVFGAFLNESA